MSSGYSSFSSLQENEALIKTAHQVQRAANEYYDQNKERCVKILNNAEHLASQNAPITEDEIDYSNPIQRDRRLMNDINAVITCENNDNWEIVSGGIPQD